MTTPDFAVLPHLAVECGLCQRRLAGLPKFEVNGGTYCPHCATALAAGGATWTFVSENRRITQYELPPVLPPSAPEQPA